MVSDMFLYYDIKLESWQKLLFRIQISPTQVYCLIDDYRTSVIQIEELTE